MLNIRKAGDRGHSNIGWLDSYHTFSFADFYDPDHMGFGHLRVINDDTVDPGAGFATHPHRDMEIISYVLEGALEHRDSMGNGSVIRPGDVQRMSAGTGVTHSEFNPSPDDPVHFLQIWILPEAIGLAPGYEQKNFTEADRRGRLALVASRDGRENSVSLNQDVDIHAGLLDGEDHVRFDPRTGRKLWIHVARGSVKVNGQLLEAGDGATTRSLEPLGFGDADSAEVLLFNMAGQT